MTGGTGGFDANGDSRGTAGNSGVGGVNGPIGSGGTGAGADLGSFSGFYRYRVMSYALACALPELFRAVAVHSGGPLTGCVQHNKPVAYFMTHGINDGCTFVGDHTPSPPNVNGSWVPAETWKFISQF